MRSGPAYHAPCRAARAIGFGEPAPIHHSTGRGGRGLTTAPLIPKRSLSTVSPASSALITRIASSRAAPRVLRSPPIAANCSSPPPMPVWTRKVDSVRQARVPTCSATSTGFHSGRRNRQPIGRYGSHSLISRPVIGTFW